MPPEANLAVRPALEPVRMPEVWLSFEEVARLESYVDGAQALSLREIQMRVREGKYLARDSDRKAKNGRAIREIALSSISPSGQSKRLAQVRDVADGIAAPLPAIPTAGGGCATPTNRGGRAALPARRLRGAAVPVLDDGEVDVDALIRAGRKAELDAYLKRKMAVAFCLGAFTGKEKRGQKGLVWRRLAIELETPRETLRHWCKTYKREGPAALVPGYGHNRGYYRAMSRELQQAVRAHFLTQQRPTIQQIMRNCVRPFCLAHRQMTPNRTTVARYIDREIFAAERSAFRRGSRDWAETIMAKVRRDPRDLAVNDLWCADHRRFDVFVLAPDGRRAIRPWLTLYLDIAAADFVGWCVRERPNSQSVALALRAGILKRGAPRVLYHDNGKEFCAKRFGGKEPWRVADPAAEDCESACRWPAVMPAALDGQFGALRLYDLGIQRVIHALPYSSWSKPIESVFHAFHAAWENLMPGYCGNSPENRPEKLQRELKERRLLTWEQFIECFRRHAEDWAANHRCGDREKSPDEAYREAQAEIRACHPTRLDLFLLATEKPRRIPPEGIEVCGKRFLDEQLALFVGEYAGVLYDPDNLSHILVFPSRYQGHKRLIVSEIPHAGWFEYSEANARILSIRKAQREQLKLVAVSNREVLVPEYADPSGANRLAAANAAEFKAERASTAEGGCATSASDLAALKAARAADKAAMKAVEKARRKRVSAAAAEMFAQVQKEAAYRAGAVNVAQPPPVVIPASAEGGGATCPEAAQ